MDNDCVEHNEYEGYIYRYTDGEMPQEGWIQSCFKCYQYTSNTVYFKQIKNRGKDFAIYIYVCRKCMNKINKSEVENVHLHLSIFSSLSSKYCFHLKCPHLLNVLYDNHDPTRHHWEFEILFSPKMSTLIERPL